MSRQRRGMSLIELLVILSILSIVLGLTLSALGEAREASNRAICVNNLRQLALAIHIYESESGGFPPKEMNHVLEKRVTPDGMRIGVKASSFSMHSFLLPYLDQVQLYNSVNFHGVGLSFDEIDTKNETVRACKVSVFLCPSDANDDPQSGGVNYRASAGTLDYPIEPPGNGAFIANRRMPLSAIRDGLSNTLTFSEKPTGSMRGQYAPFRDWYVNDSGLDPRTDSEWVTSCTHEFDQNRYYLDSGRTWLLGGARYTTFVVKLSPNSPVPDCGTLGWGGIGLFTARSRHPGGVNAALADGSVRWITSSINPEVWKSLGTRAGNELP